MKNTTAFAAAGLCSLFAWGAAFAQSPSQIPVGAGANVTRQPAGSRFRNPTNPPPAVVAPVPVAAPTAFSWTRSSRNRDPCACRTLNLGENQLEYAASTGHNVTLQ